MDGRSTRYEVGRVAELAGVTVRTLHHYDRIGLLVPGARTAAGYRLYSEEDLDRLHRIVLYRGLGFSLEQVTAVLDEADVDGTGHLRRQLTLLSGRIADLQEMHRAVERMLEAEQMGVRLTREEQFEIFGPDWPGEEHEAEARQRWGDTDAWAQSRRRTSGYGREQWQQVKAEQDAVEQALAAALRAGEPADGTVAMDLAEEHRAQIQRWFYDCDHAFHVGLGQMYVQDPRFTEHYERIAPGLAPFVCAAITANAARAEAPASR